MIDGVNPHGMPDSDPLPTASELALFLGGSGDSWTGDYLRLYAKSDPVHRARLGRAYPVHAAAWELWQSMHAPTVGALAEALRDRFVGDPTPRPGDYVVYTSPPVEENPEFVAEAWRTRRDVPSLVVAVTPDYVEITGEEEHRGLVHCQHPGGRVHEQWSSSFDRVRVVRRAVYRDMP